MKSLKNIFQKLEIDKSENLYQFSEKKWRGKFSKRIEKLLENELQPDALFRFENKPFILFYNSPVNQKQLFEKIWNFNETPIVIIVENNAISILNGFSYDKNKSCLSQLTTPDKLTDFSYFELVTGKTWEKYYNEINKKTRVDFQLLENIKAAHNIFTKKYELIDEVANSLIGRSIFVRYLIDRKVKLNFENESKIWSKEDFYELLKSPKKTILFFKYLKEKFNGDLFPIKEKETKFYTKRVLNLLIGLLQGDDLSDGTISMFDIYDFSIIPVEFISNVYELFIGKDNQAKKGAYYTPPFLVDYITSETVGNFFKKNKNETTCKVLDPACGSGIFLVESLRKTIEQFEVLNPNYKKEEPEKYKKSLKKLLTENIFGIDKDESAISIAIFSLYIVLLEFLEPKEIEAFQFPELLNKNLFASDFFEFDSDILKSKKLDFIIGNPPWKRGGSKESSHIKYIEDRKNREKVSNKKNEISIGNKEIAAAFVLRCSDFSTVKTQCALIVTSKILYNLNSNAEKFRKYFIKNFFINKVFELAPVRREVFDKSNDKAIAPAVILFFNYSYGKDTSLNELIHYCLKPNMLFSLFKIFVLQKTDIKTIVQKRLEYDWLWKVLVYGSYLDFNFIKRIKDDYETIEQIISERKYIFGQGIQFGKDKNPVGNLWGQTFIKTRNVLPFKIIFSKDKFNERYVHRVRDKRLYQGNKLLIRKGLTKSLTVIAAISYKNAIFKDSLTAIKIFKTAEIENLRIISGLLQSPIFSYFTLYTGASVGIEREQAFHKDKFLFPFIKSKKIAEIVSKIEKIEKELQKSDVLLKRQYILEEKKSKLLIKLNETILEIFSLTEAEKTLVDYAINITIPLIMKHSGYEKQLCAPIEYKDKFLEEYANLFISRFGNIFNSDGKYFEAEIYLSDYIVGMFFKIVPKPPKEKIVWKDIDDKNFLIKIAGLGCSKITDSLFVQKDIRGFEKDGFYIIKPNEKKLWHKAIGYLDLDEFVDAILRTGKEAYNG